MIGKTISHYKILEKLGEGGMGVVYKAEDLKLKRIVALKFLPPELTRDPEAKERFIQEAQAASALDHPNICNIHEIDETEDGQMFICMAYYEGETLKKKVASGQSREAGSRSAGLSVDSVIDIAIQIAQGLVKAHEHGIVHRDIKPGNIMITKDGMVKILDFGLAKLIGKTRLTKTGTTMGTISYISPEQAQGGEADHRSDIWALGVVMYEMLTGELPFKGEYDQVLIYSIIDQEPEEISQLLPEVPIELETIVNKTLTKNPDERYQNVNDLIANIKDNANINKKEISTPTTKFLTRNRLLLIGAVVLMLIFLLIFGQPFFKGNNEVIDSIAVLPLKNLMNDPNQDYFVEGMHDALITNLSHVSALKKVISRTSVMQYKETKKPMPQIAQELDVDALIEGSVLWDGDRVRITAQLIHGSTDRHLWAKSFDHDLRNVLILLNKVSQAIINEIEIVLTQQEKNRLNAVQVVNPEAHDAHLKARYYFYKFTGVEDFNLALKYYQKAIDIDPNFAPSWAALSSVYALLGGFGYVPVGEAISKAKEAAYKALELDSQLAGAYTALGFALLYDWDWQGAEKAFQRALELNPSNPFAYHGLGDYLTVMGNLEQGLNLVIKGQECSPFSPITNYPVAGHLYLLHRYDEVIDEAQRQINMGPNFQRVRSVLSDALWQKGRYEQSIEELKKTRHGKDSKLMEALEKGYIKSGARGAMLWAAKLLADRSKSKHVDPLDVAFYFARAEEVDSTFNWLEKAYKMRAPLLWHVKVFPEFDFLRSDPRYHDLLNRMGLSENIIRE